MKKMGLTLIAVLLLVAGAAHSDESQSQFHQANQLYEQGEYAKAVEVYEGILSDGKESWQLYFNLGNTYYKLNQTGNAILNYESALKLNSENQDIRFNLQLANLSTVDRIPEPPKAEWIQWIETIVNALSLSTLVWLTIGLYACLLIIVSLQNLKQEMATSSSVRMLRQFLIPVLAVATIWFGYRWYKFETEAYAIVLQQKVSVSSSPTTNSTEVFELHEGTKVRIEQSADTWAKIRLQDGKVGWLRTSALGMI